MYGHGELLGIAAERRDRHGLDASSRVVLAGDPWMADVFAGVLGGLSVGGTVLLSGGADSATPGLGAHVERTNPGGEYPDT